MSPILRSLVLLFLAASWEAGGEVLYVLRRDSTGQGIYRLDTNSDRVAAPFAQFVYSGGLYGPFGDRNLRLTSSDGLVHLHGSLYYEFDERSGQLLRRFQALDRRYAEWGFHGVAVDPALARELGIEPGHYGNVHCISGHGNGCLQPPDPFPGYQHPVGRPRAHVLLRRNWEPHDTRLELAAEFAPAPPNSVRFGGIDVALRRFLFIVQSSVGAQTQQTLTAWDLKDTTETILRQVTHSGLSDGGWFLSGMAVSGREVPTQIFLNTQSLSASTVKMQRLNGEETDVLHERYHGITDITTQASHAASLQQQLFPIVGETAGVNGTFWRSDAWFFNPSSSETTVRLRLLSQTAVALEFTLGSHESRELLNILRILRGASPETNVTDAVIIESDSRPGAQLSAYSRTYTMAENGGTYGQLVPAVPLRAGYSNHIPLSGGGGLLSETLSVLPMDRRRQGQYRHNFGAANTTDEPAEFTFVYASMTGENPPAGRGATVTIPPRSVRQFTIESLFSEEVMNSLPPYVVVSGATPLPTWMSIVDNRSGDASFIPFTLSGVESMPGATLAIPAIIRSPGAHGTSWKSDAYGVFAYFVTDGSAQEPSVVFRGAGGCGNERMTLTPELGFASSLEWPTFWRTVYPDLVAQVCGETTAAGALEVETGSWMSMVSRTYTTREDGGTYGDILPLYPPRGWPERHFAGLVKSDHFRVNIGLYNGTAAAATQTLQLYHADGSLLATRDVSLAPYESRQTPLEQLFDVQNGLHGLSVTSESGVWPWVSIVDNRTGDPTNLW